MSRLLISVCCCFVLQNVVAYVSEDACVSNKCSSAVNSYKLKSARRIGATPLTLAALQVNSASDSSSLRTVGGDQCLDCDVIERLSTENQDDSSGRRRRRRRQAYNFTGAPDRQWSLPVNYVLDNSLPSDVSISRTILNAIEHIEAQTCIRFTAITTTASDSYMSYQLSSGCSSFVAKSLQTIENAIYATDSCLRDFGEMLYLTVQSLGMWHETQRTDRDLYVTISTSNVLTTRIGDFGTVDSSLLVTYGLPYDYASIVHFPPKKYSKNDNYTIVTTDKLYQHTIGQRVQLSFLDTKLLNRMYCSAICSRRPLSGECQNGGYQNPNNCSRCRCPDGYAGDFCTELEPSLPIDLCGGKRNATDAEQTIESPGYFTPGYYDEQVKCVWSVSAPIGRTIQMYFRGDFGIYCREEACQHWAQINYRGKLNETGPRFCCESRPTDILVSSSNAALVIFHSNISDIAQSKRRGFQLVFALTPLITTGGVPTTVFTSTTTTPFTTPGASTTTTTPLPTSTAITTPPPTSPTTSIGVDSPCNPNPCRNGGNCTPAPGTTNGYNCTCVTPFKGPTCEKACCGGCDISPGQTQQPCIVDEVPARLCNVTEPISRDDDDYRGHRRGWWWAHRRGHRRGGRFGGFDDSSDSSSSDDDDDDDMVVERPCTVPVCCDNAVAINSTTGPHGFVCAVVGWTDWGNCNASCGGGYKFKQYYDVTVEYNANGQTIIGTHVTNTTMTECNMEECSCPYFRWGWFHQKCNYCNSGFFHSGHTCHCSRH